MNFDRLSEYIKGLPETENIHGCDCAVFKGYDCVFRQSAGFSDANNTKPVSKTDRYILYSATKVVTAVLAMQCIEKGVFTLDTPIYKFLPEFEDMELSSGGRAKTKITIWHLLTMQAGFSYDYGAAPIQQLIKTNPAATTAEFVTALSEVPLLFVPGTHFRYSFCHDVLARVIEAALSKKYSECAKDRIFAPLCMHSTGYSHKEAAPYLTQQYKFNWDKGVPEITENKNPLMFSDNFESGGAGLFSTVDDYSKFVVTLANYGKSADGVRIISKESIDLMRKDHLSPVSFNDFVEFNKPGYSYGLGVRTLIDKSKGAKSPLGEFGWDGAGGAYVMLDVENSIGIFYAQQLIERDVANIIHTKIRNLVYESL